MRITEIFASIQGEGARTGVPTTFVRFAGCNIIKQCQGCDTPQARALAQGEEISQTDLIRKVSGGITNVCFTGGEPMLQVGDWLQAARELERMDHQLSMETNGTIWIGGEVRKLFNWIVVSPKTAEMYTLPGILAAGEVKIPLFHPNVLSSDDGAMFTRVKRQILHMNDNARISVQPWLTGDEAVDKRRIADAFEFCLANDVRLSLQVHKLIGVR